MISWNQIHYEILMFYDFLHDTAYHNFLYKYIMIMRRSMTSINACST
jgi:hypothetical protein